jgi:type II secretory pathway pseudopilin PulG
MSNSRAMTLVDAVVVLVLIFIVASVLWSFQPGPSGRIAQNHICGQKPHEDR